MRMFLAIVILTSIPVFGWSECLDKKDATVAPARGVAYYFVTRGDTYERIAQREGVDADALRALNGDVLLRAGRILRLPGDAAPSPRQQGRRPQVRQDGRFYFVVTGDTYERIAQRKGVDADALRALNQDISLRAGRILRLPVDAAPVRPEK